MLQTSGRSLANVLCLDAQRSEDSLRLNRTLILVWHSFTLQFSGFSSSVLKLLRSHYSLRACKRKDRTLYYCVLFQCFLLHYPVGTRLYYHPLYFTWLRYIRIAQMKMIRDCWPYTYGHTQNMSARQCLIPYDPIPGHHDVVKMNRKEANKEITR